jgi:hypothetical protein
MANKWFVRGVPKDLTDATTATAKAHGVTVGHLVAQALRTYLQVEQPQPAPSKVAASDQYAAMLRRLEALEVQVRQTKPNPKRNAKRRGGLRPEVISRIAALAAAGEHPMAIVAATGASRASVYRHLARLDSRPAADGASPGVVPSEQDGSHASP